MNLKNKDKSQQIQENQAPDKSLIFAKSTSIAMFIVLLTLGAIFLILTLLK